MKTWHSHFDKVPLPGFLRVWSQQIQGFQGPAETLIA